MAQASTLHVPASEPLAGAASGAADPYGIERVHGAVRLTGELRMADASAIWRELCARTADGHASGLDFDLSRVELIDGGIMSLVVQRRAELVSRGVPSELTGASERVTQLVHLYGGDLVPTRRKRRRAEGLIAQVGRMTMDILGELKLVITFFGSMVAAAVGVARRPRTGNWGDVIPLMERTGANAVPIVLLINFLMGFGIGFQAAKQLQTYGASLFVADLVGISMTRELGPLMTGIIVCGRSGAAFAAELGTMKVSEEIDALRAMGFGPVRYLVLPRTIALVLVTPVLTLFGDLVGTVGGMVVGATVLGITPGAYLTQTMSAVELWDVESGLIKSVAYAIAIALIACQQGFATSGGAEGVGRRTTSTVVIGLFALVALDAMFTIAFRALGQ